MSTDLTRRLMVALQWLVLLAGIGLVSAGLAIPSGKFDEVFFRLIALVKGTEPAPHWLPELRSLSSHAVAFGLVFSAFGLWVLPRLGSAAVSQLPSSQQAATTAVIPISFNRWDALVMLGFAFFAALLSIGRLQGNVPFTYIDGDAAYLAGMAAARADPLLFNGDEMLGSPENFRNYSSLTLPLLQAAKGWVGDYGLAFTVLLGPHALLQLAGFYLFGRVLFGSRIWATFLSILMCAPVPLSLGEHWGVGLIPLPRMWFQSLLPYVLTAALLWRAKPRRWPWLMVMAGAMTYMHLVSGPTWGLAIWLAFWGFLPETWSRARQLGYMFLLGVLFLLTVSPIALNYLQSHAPLKAADYDRVLAIMEANLPSKILDPPAALVEFFWVSSKRFIVPLALLGSTALGVLRPSSPRAARLIVLWIVGILIAAAVIPTIENAIERQLRVVPIQMDMIRGVRYFVMFGLLLAIWPLAELSARLKNLADRKGLVQTTFAGALLVGAWCTIYRPFPDLLSAGGRCLLQGRLVCANSGSIGTTLDRIRQVTPEGSRILATALTEQIRFRSMRPVLYSQRDSGLGMANHAALLEWERRSRALAEITRMPDEGPKVARLAALGRQLGADYLFIDFPVETDAIAMGGLVFVFEEEPYSLLRIR